jgi:hypothetical protein
MTASVMADGFSKLCEWCEQPFRARRGGSPQRFCGARCKKMYWSAVRGFGERALANGILTMADIRTGIAVACTLPQRTELLSPLPETSRSNSAPPGALLRFSVEVERSIVAWLGTTRLIKPNEAHDLAAILTALQRIGLTPSISCSA